MFVVESDCELEGEVGRVDIGAWVWDEREIVEDEEWEELRGGRNEEGDCDVVEESGVGWVRTWD